MHTNTIFKLSQFVRRGVGAGMHHMMDHLLVAHRTAPFDGVTHHFGHRKPGV
jgi:hypothetical protein